MKAAVYLRISEDREGRELGVTRQREDCLALADRLGAVVYDIYEDNDKGASTRSKKVRKGYRRLMDDAKAGRFDMIISYTSGRLTRRPREHEDQIELAEHHGIRFEYVASPSFDLNTSAGRRIARMLAANDAGEAEDISERVQRETLQRAQQGRPHGGPRSYGYSPNGRELVAEEADRVADWYSTILAGGSIRGIRLRLTRNGILTPAGKPWHDSSIRCILTNERNAGFRLLKGERFDAAGPAIVPEATYLAVTAILNNPARKTNHRGMARRWLGAGLFVCDRCSAEPVTQPVRTSYDGIASGSYRVYVCKTCSRSWKAEPIDDFVTGLIAARLSKPDVANLLKQPERGPDVSTLSAEAVAIRKRLEQMAEDFADGLFTREQLRAATERGRARLDEIDREMSRTGESSVLASLVLAPDPAQLWLGLGEQDTDRRQAILRTLAQIRLGSPIRGRATWDPLKFITVRWH